VALGRRSIVQLRRVPNGDGGGIPRENCTKLQFCRVWGLRRQETRYHDAAAAIGDAAAPLPPSLPSSICCRAFPSPPLLVPLLLLIVS